MPNFKVAHIKEQGVDLIIIPLESSFGDQPDDEKRKTRAELQAHATAAGFAGSVILVWDAGGGRMGHLAPFNWNPALNDWNLFRVSEALNGEIYW